MEAAAANLSHVLNNPEIQEGLTNFLALSKELRQDVSEGATLDIGQKRQIIAAKQQLLRLIDNYAEVPPDSPIFSDIEMLSLFPKQIQDDLLQRVEQKGIPSEEQATGLGKWMDSRGFFRESASHPFWTKVELNPPNLTISLAIPGQSEKSVALKLDEARLKDIDDAAAQEILLDDAVPALTLAVMEEDFKTPLVTDNQEQAVGELKEEVQTLVETVKEQGKREESLPLDETDDAAHLAMRRSLLSSVLKANSKASSEDFKEEKLVADDPAVAQVEEAFSELAAYLQENAPKDWEQEVSALKKLVEGMIDPYLKEGISSKIDAVVQKKIASQGWGFSVGITDLGRRLVETTGNAVGAITKTLFYSRFSLLMEKADRIFTMPDEHKKLFKQLFDQNPTLNVDEGVRFQNLFSEFVDKVDSLYQKSLDSLKEGGQLPHDFKQISDDLDADLGKLASIVSLGETSEEIRQYLAAHNSFRSLVEQVVLGNVQALTDSFSLMGLNPAQYKDIYGKLPSSSPAIRMIEGGEKLKNQPYMTSSLGAEISQRGFGPHVWEEAETHKLISWVDWECKEYGGEKGDRFFRSGVCHFGLAKYLQNEWGQAKEIDMEIDLSRLPIDNRKKAEKFFRSLEAVMGTEKEERLKGAKASLEETFSPEDAETVWASLMNHKEQIILAMYKVKFAVNEPDEAIPGVKNFPQ